MTKDWHDEIEMELQKLLTIEYGGGTDTIMLHQSEWLDTQGMGYVAMTTQIPHSDASSALLIEASDTVEGPWTEVARFTNIQSATPQDTVLTTQAPYSSYNRLRRYIRWRWSPPTTPGTYFITFRMCAVVKP